jgi:hypothetical protein
LCGTSPPRGVCFPATGLSKCQCFDTGDPSTEYTGEFCALESDTTTEAPALSASSPSNWTPIIIGIVSGVAGLFCAITCCLLAVAVWRRRRRIPPNE